MLQHLKKLNPTTSHNHTKNNKQNTKYTWTQSLKPINDVEKKGASNSSTTSQFMLKRGSYKNYIPLTNHVPITLTDGVIIKSMQTCELNLTNLAEESRLA